MMYLVLFLTLLWSSIAEATTRYVATTGSDAVSCATSANIGTPKLTLTSAIACMSAGDILYVRAGTYTDANLNPPAGSSASVPTIVEAYQDESVTIRPASGTRVIYNTGRAYVKFWNLDLDGVNQTSDVVKLDAGSHNFILGGDLTSGGVFRCIIRNSGNMGFSLQGVSNDVMISGCDIYDNALTVTTSPYAHGIYIQQGSGFILEKSTVRRNGCNGIQLYSSPTNAILRRNKFYDNARTSGCGTQVYISNDNHVVEYNQVWNDLESGNTYGIRVQLTSPTGNIIRHNTVYNGGTTGIYVGSDATSTTLQNNLVIDSTTAINDLGTSTTLTDNLTSGTASTIFTSVVSGSINLSLKAGTTPIDGGTAIGGTANGTPDQGAHEVPTFSACSVESSATSVVRVTFTNNLRPPMLPASTVTGLTVRRNGSNNAVVSSTRATDNTYEVTVTNAYVGGDTVDVSIVPASTNLTDSALIGFTNNQPFVSTVTNTSCTNNAAGVAYTYTQARYEHHDWRGLEASPTVLPHGFATTGAAENFSNFKVRPSGKVRTRFAIVCGGADCPVSSFHPYFSTGGAYAEITDTFASNNIKMCGIPSGTDMSSNGSASTNQLSTAGTFAAGGIVYTSNGVPEVSGLNNGYKTELEYCFEFDSDASGNFDIRVYLDTGTALNTYTVTPRLVIEPAASGGAGM